MNTLHRISQAEILAALANQTHAETESYKYELAVTGNWTGQGQIEFSALNGSSTGPFRDIFAFSFTATSKLGTTEFRAIDLAFAYWSMGPSGLLNSFSILTNRVDGFAMSIQLGEDGAKLEGKKFSTVEAGTLTHSISGDGGIPDFADSTRLWPGGPSLRSV